MTEYDYSPAAQQAYQDKLRSIANWNNRVPAHHHQLSNPFVPSESGKSDFFASQKKSRKNKNSSSGRRGRRRERRGYDSDGDDDSDSDYSGPDRPPTPPASAPVYGGFGPPAQPAFYVSPYGAAVSPQGYGAAAGGYYQQPTTAPASNMYVPMWVGGRMVYQPLPQPQPQPQQPASASLISTHPDYETRPRRHRSRSRPRAHRRNSHSVPAFPSPPLSPYNNPSYAYGYATGYLYPSWSQQMGSNGVSTNTSPQSMYSAPLPAGGGGPGPTPYVRSPPPPLATACTGPAAGYFGSQPHSAGYGAPGQVMVPQVISGGMATSPYQVTVQSPNGSASVYSGQSGYTGYPPGVVVVGAAPRKSSRSGGSSRRSWLGKFTSGM